MAPWRNICCAVDFTPASRLAAREAAELARRDGAALTLVYVNEALPASGLDLLLAPPEALAAARCAAEKELARWRDEAQRLSAAVVHCATLAGDPADAITRYAAGRRCDLVVLGTHRRGAREHLASSSVAQQLVLDPPCSVLVVHAPAAVAAERPLPFDPLRPEAEG